MNLNTSSQGTVAAFSSALGFTLNDNANYGPSANISNGFSGVTQYNYPLGPQWASDYHADLSKTIGQHTIGIGGMYYRIKSYDGATNLVTNFTRRMQPLKVLWLVQRVTGLQALCLVLSIA